MMAFKSCLHSSANQIISIQTIQSVEGSAKPMGYYKGRTTSVLIEVFYSMKHHKESIASM